MYVRFEGQVPNVGARSRLGIFLLAGELRDHPETPSWVHDEVQAHLGWLNANLHVPDVLMLNDNMTAICWFKSGAHEPMKRVRALKALLEEFGYTIDVITSSTPGTIVYEDDWQVAAKPVRRVRRRRVLPVHA